MAAMEAAETSDGPVLSLMNKRLRALRKKYNRIIQMEESMSQGKPLNKEQEDVLRSKPGVVALIEEYEKLRQPLTSAVQEEIQQAMLNLNTNAPENHDTSSPSEEVHAEATTQRSENDAVEDLLKLVYFGTLFDVKTPSDLNSMVLTRVHERTSCLTYDYVTEDATDLLAERDLDLLSLLGNFVIARPANSTLSHMNALNTCLQHAKHWLQNSDQPIHPEVDISYAGLRERLNKILSLEYFTTTPEMMTLSQHSTVEAGTVIGNYVSQSMVNDATLQGPIIQADNALAHYQHKGGEDADTFQAMEQSGALTIHSDQSNPSEEQQLPEDAEREGGLDPGEDAAAVSYPLQDEQKMQQQPSDGEDHQEYYNQRGEVELKGQQHQQYVPRRMTGYSNQRGGNRGARRGGGGYMNGRGGGRGGSRGGGGYQNGRSQYYDQGNYYPPRNFYGQRGGRGVRGGGTAIQNNGRASIEAESDQF